MIDPDKLKNINYEKSIIISTIKHKALIKRDILYLSYCIYNKINLSIESPINNMYINKVYKPIMKICVPLGITIDLNNNHDVSYTFDCSTIVDSSGEDRYCVMDNFNVEILYNLQKLKQDMFIKDKDPIFNIEFIKGIAPINPKLNPIIENIYIFESEDIYHDFENMLCIEGNE